MYAIKAVIELLEEKGIIARDEVFEETRVDEQ